jgi:hypothetical protein
LLDVGRRDAVANEDDVMLLLDVGRLVDSDTGNRMDKLMATKMNRWLNRLLLLGLMKIIRSILMI